MKTLKINLRLIATFMMIVMVLSCISVDAASNKTTITGYNAPSSLKYKANYTLKGTIKSNKTIKRVEIGVTTKGGGKWTAQKYDNKKVNAKSFKVSKANSKVKFSKLKSGTYYYRIYVHTSDKKCATVINKKFVVKSPSAPYITGHNYPTSINEGNGFGIKGTVKAPSKMSKITVGVVNKSNGKWTAQKYTKSISAKSFSIKKADPYIKFGKLSPGTYYYRVTAKVGSKTTTVLNQAFQVVSTKAPSTSMASTNAGSGVTVTKYNLPSTYVVGKTFSPKGTINSKEKIKRVEIGIVVGPTNKWSDYKYDNTLLIPSNSFDIAKAAPSLPFDKLPAGTYFYRIYVHTEKGINIAVNRGFEVKTSGRPQAAVNWAINIANDNSFSYGLKPATSRAGCYFCGTNQKNKPKGYEKTYVCMTFAHAAYAHGAKDPEMLKHCQGGKYGIGESDANFKEYTCWFKVGLCKDLKVADLLPGDIICWYDANDTHGHLAIYAGNNRIVDSLYAGWGADTIALRDGCASTYLTKGASRNAKSYVMRYIH